MLRLLALLEVGENERAPGAGPVEAAGSTPDWPLEFFTRTQKRRVPAGYSALQDGCVGRGGRLNLQNNNQQVRSAGWVCQGEVRQRVTCVCGICVCARERGERERERERECVCVCVCVCVCMCLHGM